MGMFLTPNRRSKIPHFAGINKETLSFLSFGYRLIKSISISLSSQDFAHKKYPRGGRGGFPASGFARWGQEAGI
jgi:hypothetical protein